MKLIGYCRVPTGKQADSGLGIAAQEAAIRGACERNGWGLVEIVSDAGMTGTKLERPAFLDALIRIADGEADGLVAAKLDRVSRSVTDLASIVDWFNQAGRTLAILDPAIDTSTASGQLVAHVLGAVAAFEAHMAGGRTRDALAARRSQGLPISGPSVADNPELAATIQGLRDEGLSMRAIAARLNADKVPTLRGAPAWSVGSVQTALGYKRPASAKRTTDLPDPRPRSRRKRTAA